MSAFSLSGNYHLSDWGKLGLVHIVVSMLYTYVCTYTRPLTSPSPFLFYGYVQPVRFIIHQASTLTSIITPIIIMKLGILRTSYIGDMLKNNAVSNQNETSWND